MNHLKMFALAAGTTMALMALAVSSASATTLEIGGTTKNESIKIAGNLSAGTSAVLSRTDGTTANTCTEGSGEGSMTSPYTGSKVTGPVTGFAGGGCANGVTVHNAGKIYIEHVSGTTNGLVYSEEGEVTVETAFGFAVNCKSNAGTTIGTLTGKASGNAVVDVNAVVNCGFLMPSATVKGTGVVKSPEGLGISA